LLGISYFMDRYSVYPSRGYPTTSIVSGPLGTATVVQNTFGYAPSRAATIDLVTEIFPTQTATPVVPDVSSEHSNHGSGSRINVENDHITKSAIVGKIHPTTVGNGDTSLTTDAKKDGFTKIAIVGNIRSTAVINGATLLVIDVGKNDFTKSPIVGKIHSTTLANGDTLLVIDVENDDFTKGAIAGKADSTTLANEDILLVSDASSILLQPKTGRPSKTLQNPSTKCATPETSTTKDESSNPVHEKKQDQEKKKSSANTVSVGLTAWIQLLFFHFVM
jgi:hypothetical protein